MKSRIRIKTFLPSPESLEIIKPFKKSKKARKERPSKQRLAKSIYEETDLSKLTLRQRVLHQRYHQNKQSASSFFLLSNNISMNNIEHKDTVSTEKAPKRSRSKHKRSIILYEIKTPEDINKVRLDAFEEYNGNLSDALSQESSYIPIESDLIKSEYECLELQCEDSSSIESSIIEPLCIESPFCDKPIESKLENSNLCIGCFKDAIRIYCKLENMNSIHHCRLQKLIMVHKHRIRQSFKQNTCFSVIKNDEVQFLYTLENARCCMP
ncbi:hypothetical protein HK407_11g16640 [Ordospora pajunii]|jgi:hypothetical protein|uniref:uncharacterized protein n=1 Tax=Ordospora pajunii TaxID=3039483 RepID=UPI002952796D|nr:uncharacterized protein HK407_11g16640 [Ordospora pajunii]KAH9410770.1 hypothetical protein HK407_11g16640 [Ordospora pajunii]